MRQPFRLDRDWSVQWGMFYDASAPGTWKWTWYPVTGTGGDAIATGRAVISMGKYKARQLAKAVSRSVELSALGFMAETYVGLVNRVVDVLDLYRRMGGKVP